MCPQPKHQSWLARVILGEPPTENPQDEEEWRELLAAAEWNGVTALVNQNLPATAGNLECPTWFLESLKNITHQIAANELMRGHEVTNATYKIDEAGIDFLLLKGTPLAYSIYPEPYLRERCDTDILFKSREQADAAWSILQAMGYERKNVISGEYVASQYACYKTSKMGILHAFDMHWKLSNLLSIANVFNFEELKAHAVSVPRLSDGIRAFGPPHAFLQACMHRMTNIEYGIANRLIWLYDIHLLARNMDSETWEITSRLSKDKGIDHMVESGVRETTKYFPTRLPDDFESRVRNTNERGDFKPEDTSQAWQVQLMDIKALPNWTNKIQFVMENLFPPVDYMKSKYETDNTLTLPYYYFLRIVGGIPKLFRKH